MSTICKYCNEPENKQTMPGLVCETCICFIHLSCLRRPGTPGDFSCDVYFSFTCEECSPTKKEIFTRNRFQWVNVILLTLHHLNTHCYGISNKGFFHYKNHICAFIHKHWSVLFGPHFKQKKNWVGTIAGALSVYNKLLFHSGSTVLAESGWWRLMHHFSPATASHIVLELTRDKPRWKRSNQPMEESLFYALVTEMGYQDLWRTEDDETGWSVQPGDQVPTKKMKLSDSDDGSRSSNFDTSRYETNRTDSLLGQDRDESYQEQGFLRVSTKSLYETNVYGNVEFSSTNFVPPSDTSSVHSLQPFAANYDSESGSRSPRECDEKTSKTNIQKLVKPKKEKEIPLNRETLFSSQLNSVDMPWLQIIPEKTIEVVPLSEYEEIQLLKKVTALIPKVCDPNKKAQLRRLRAKLAMRRVKRHRHLKLFDFDKSVKLLGGYPSEESKCTFNMDRVLDRFQRSYIMEELSGTVVYRTSGLSLSSRAPPVCFRSPYSGALLKPYIRRDFRTTPPWLALTEELMKKTNGAEYVHSRACVEYSYLRPQHLAAVNSLCEQFFWPGIDLSEALQYPEFSCVVLYRQLVVGVACLVPDASAGAAYISFLLTRPEWRRAGLATFMLYHLLQTCTGRDVTLHVSPTNPAIFLYQKFGFKVEELVQDFYEKYFDVHHKGCRHALFLRLTR